MATYVNNPRPEPMLQLLIYIIIIRDYVRIGVEAILGTGAIFSTKKVSAIVEILPYHPTIFEYIAHISILKYFILKD